MFYGCRLADAALRRRLFATFRTEFEKALDAMERKADALLERLSGLLNAEGPHPLTPSSVTGRPPHHVSNVGGACHSLRRSCYAAASPSHFGRWVESLNRADILDNTLAKIASGRPAICHLFSSLTSTLSTVGMVNFNSSTCALRMVSSSWGPS
jgi:hypothetical protein